MPFALRKTMSQGPMRQETEDDGMPITTTPPAEGKTNKRGHEKDKMEMQIESDPNKITALQTQIALLQRELAKETGKVQAKDQSKGSGEMV